MAKKRENFRLTLKTARALVKQEFNLHGDFTVERAEHGVYIYVMQIGKFEVMVSNDWYEKNGLISLHVAHNAGELQMYFDPDTLKEDDDAEAQYRREVADERCDGCAWKDGGR